MTFFELIPTLLISRRYIRIYTPLFSDKARFGEAISDRGNIGKGGNEHGEKPYQERCLLMGGLT
jgi:hypothetical protein